MLDVALEVPLTFFSLGRLVEGDDSRHARVEVFGEALDRATLAGCVAAFEDDDVFGAAVLRRVLEFQQLDLELTLFLLVLGPAEEVFVRVAVTPGFDGIAQGVDQIWVLPVDVRDGVSLVAHLVDVLAQVLVTAHGA